MTQEVSLDRQPTYRPLVPSDSRIRPVPTIRNVNVTGVGTKVVVTQEGPTAVEESCIRGGNVHGPESLHIRLLNRLLVLGADKREKTNSGDHCPTTSSSSFGNPSASTAPRWARGLSPVRWRPGRCPQVLVQRGLNRPRCTHMPVWGLHRPCRWGLSRPRETPTPLAPHWHLRGCYRLPGLNRPRCPHLPVWSLSHWLTLWRLCVTPIPPPTTTMDPVTTTRKSSPTMMMMMTPTHVIPHHRPDV
jgi:hypothetical protein